ncbi:hypothetical protein B0H11DRAFT_1739813 [Mycena galericulata]|nr:hypothetical protein B0H11DRAFT_1739813 [Mycena galericulata]
MQARRPSTGLTPLAIVLPHPSLPRRRSSLLSSAPSPRTPRTGSSPTCSSLFFATAANRKSTDSWNSSNQDLVDDLDYDWKPDQIRLLRRTLDALPPHLMTPFNGPIPPSNLLDKIARGVTQAKGEDWPHSLRATRVKLIEVARTIAEEDNKSRKTIPEENAMDCSDYPYFAEADVLQQTTNIGIGNTGLGIGIGLGPRRPLYRQSSMDFLNNPSEPHDDDSINRLSTRLQKADRFIPNSSYHPYSRSQINRRSSSPPRHIPSLISPSTPSTSTLSSLASLSTAGAHPRVLRRSASITSSSTTSNSRMSLSSAGGLPPVAADPRVQRVRRSESFCGPSVLKEPLARHAVKRAPSYGALAQEARDKMPMDDGLIVPCPSSDEEEKIRTRRAKKPRMRSTSTSISAGSPPPSPTPSSPPSSATRSPISARPKTKACPEEPGLSKRTTKSRANVSQAPVDLPKSGRERPRGMNIKRNPSMFGAELPRLPASMQGPETPAVTPALSAAPLLAPAATEKVKTLRRVRRLPPARRISFGSLIPPVGEDGHEADMEEERGLGSAFQLR